MKGLAGFLVHPTPGVEHRSPVHEAKTDGSFAQVLRGSLDDAAPDGRCAPEEKASTVGEAQAPAVVGGASIEDGSATRSSPANLAKTMSGSLRLASSGRDVPEQIPQGSWTEAGMMALPGAQQACQPGTRPESAHSPGTTASQPQGEKTMSIPTNVPVAVFDKLSATPNERSGVSNEDFVFSAKGEDAALPVLDQARAQGLVPAAQQGSSEPGTLVATPEPAIPSLPKAEPRLTAPASPHTLGTQDEPVAPQPAFPADAGAVSLTTTVVSKPLERMHESSSSPNGPAGNPSPTRAPSPWSASPTQHARKPEARPETPALPLGAPQSEPVVVEPPSPSPGSPVPADRAARENAPSLAQSSPAAPLAWPQAQAAIREAPAALFSPPAGATAATQAATPTDPETELAKAAPAHVAIHGRHGAGTPPPASAKMNHETPLVPSPDGPEASSLPASPETPPDLSGTPGGEPASSTPASPETPPDPLAVPAVEATSPLPASPEMPPDLQGTATPILGQAAPAQPLSPLPQAPEAIRESSPPRSQPARAARPSLRPAAGLPQGARRLAAESTSHSVETQLAAPAPSFEDPPKAAEAKAEKHLRSHAIATPAPAAIQLGESLVSQVETPPPPVAVPLSSLEPPLPSEAPAPPLPSLTATGPRGIVVPPAPAQATPAASLLETTPVRAEDPDREPNPIASRSARPASVAQARSPGARASRSLDDQGPAEGADPRAFHPLDAMAAAPPDRPLPPLAPPSDLPHDISTTPSAPIPASAMHASPVEVRHPRLPTRVATLAAQGIREDGLNMTVMPHAAHMAIESSEGDLALHLRVRRGSADVTVAGSMAPLFEARAPEARAALASEGLSLGRFDLGQQAGGGQQQGQPAPERPERAPEPASPYRQPANNHESTPGDGRIHVTA